MKKTKESLKLNIILVDVIQWLDSNGHNNEPIRELVDKVLSSSTWNKLEELKQRNWTCSNQKKKASL